MPDLTDTRFSLDDVPEGALARVVMVQAADGEGLLHAAALGLLPGTVVSVVRRFPVLCVMLDGACYALDGALSRGVLVEVVRERAKE